MTKKDHGDDAADPGIQSITRASAILEVVADHAVKGARLGEVVRATGLNNATVHRILKSLVQTGLLEKDKQDPIYFPGMKLVAIAASASNRFGLAKQCAEGCARIAEQTRDTVFLQLRVAREVVCVLRTEGTYPIKALTLDVGERRPIGIGAGGLAVLAFSDPVEARELVESEADAYEDYGVASEQIVSGIERARVAGYALDKDTIIPGITGVAVPILDEKGIAVAALTVAAISIRLSGTHREDVVARLREEAANIQSDLAPILASHAGGTRHRILKGR